MIDDLPDDVPFESVTKDDHDSKVKAFEIANKRADVLRDGFVKLQDDVDEEITSEKADLTIAKQGMDSDLASLKIAADGAKLSADQALLSTGSVVSQANALRSSFDAANSAFSFANSTIATAVSVASQISAIVSTESPRVSSAHSQNSSTASSMSNLRFSVNADAYDVKSLELTVDFNH